MTFPSFSFQGKSFAADDPPGTSAYSTWTDTLPSVDAGDLLLVGFKCADSALSATVSDDSATETAWTQLVLHDTSGDTDENGLVYYKIAEGDEDGKTLTITASGSPGSAGTNGQMVICKITGWFGTSGGIHEVHDSPPANVSGTVNPPATGDVSWGSADNLFILFILFNDDDATISATDLTTAGYTRDFSTLLGTGGNSSANVALAHRNLAAASDDIGDLTVTDETSERWSTVVVVIRPAAGGGTFGGLALLGVGI